MTSPPGARHDEETGGAEGASHIAAFFRAREVALGLGRIIALHHRPSTLHRNRSHIRCLCF